MNRASTIHLPVAVKNSCTASTSNASPMNAKLDTNTSRQCSNYGAMDFGHISEETPEEYWMPLKVPAESGKKNPPSRSDLTSVASDNVSAFLDDMIAEERTLMDRFFAILGFTTNPFASDADVRNNRASDMRLAMLSNFSTAYNVVSISMALDIMQELYDTTAEDKSLCSSALIAGMIIGQLAGGAVGDIIGRHMAMATVMSLQIVGATMTACASEGHVSIFAFIAFCRLVLGIGCGGVYPLAATITAESNSDGQDGGKAVALTFSMQGVGYLFPPILTAILTRLIPLDWCWRIILGFGAIPGLWLMVLRLKNQMMQPKLDMQKQKHILVASAREVPVNVLGAIWMEKDLLRKMMGTGGCWFLFDVLFYGNVLFQPIVLSAAFGQAETVQKAAIDSAVLSLLALPGYFASVIAIGRQSPRWIQAQGFFMMAVLYGFIGVVFEQLSRHKLALVVLYGGTFFFSNYGPNATVRPRRELTAQLVAS
jgi:MFS transporter, PHS family, inorganic phosphate transporter